MNKKIPFSLPLLFRTFERSTGTLHLFALIILLSNPVQSADIIDFLPLTDRIVMLHLNEGHVVHHERGQSRNDEQVIIDPLDIPLASNLDSYTIRSSDDKDFPATLRPTQISRKSKGTDFAWFIDKWENGHAVNTRPDHTKEHWIYLFLSTPMRHGKIYTIETGSIAKNGKEWKILFDESTTRSEAVHVNLLGYKPTALEKFGYVYHWLGDKGGVDLKAYEGAKFALMDQETHKTAFTGKLKFRFPANQPETAHQSDSPPHGNFLNADVYECDFSTFTKPGRYVLAIQGIGCSFPFEIADDVYRSAFQIVARGLYHNRSGIALEKPYTTFTRPAPHNPKLTTGFKDKLSYTTVRFIEWGSEGGDAKLLQANIKGPIESAGWYQDAGDWDSYYSHLRVAQELLLTYEMAPDNFTDRELNIPESGNGLPDILDEAAWLPRFCYRLRHELIEKGYGTGGLGLRIAGDAFGGDEKSLPGGKNVGQGSWEDVNRIWVASGEDPWSTYRYAGAAAHLAYCLQLKKIKDPEGVNWAKEAEEAFDWARKNTKPSDDGKSPPLSEPRSYAAAALFRLTGKKEFEKQFADDNSDLTSNTILGDDRQYGPMVYALGAPNVEQDTALKSRTRAAVLATADAIVGSAAKRSLRWGGNWYMPMLVGHQTTPLVLPAMVACTLTKESDPEKSKAYRATLLTTCDYFLGCNALNMTWVTGLGPRHPNQVFHIDAWYNGQSTIHPGIIPYGPWRKERTEGQGPWDQAWPHKTVYPPIDSWPGNERWFDNRCSPMNSEFTVHQNAGPAAALFGYLCNPSQ